MPVIPLSKLPRWWFDANGKPLQDAVLEVYKAGTTTPLKLYRSDGTEIGGSVVISADGQIHIDDVALTAAASQVAVLSDAPSVAQGRNLDAAASAIGIGSDAPSVSAGVSLTAQPSAVSVLSDEASIRVSVEPQAAASAVHVLSDAPTVTVSVDLIPDSTLFHSVARAIGDYSGSLVRVRRSSDNAELDIGFDSNGNLDETELLNHVGPNDGYLVRVYEQITGTYHLEQTTAASQPRIVNAGTVETDNGKPAAYFVSDSDFLATSSFSSAIAQPDTIFAVYHIEDVSASSDQFVIDSNTTSPDRQFLGTNNQNWTSYAASFIGSSASASSIQVIHTGLFDGANSEIWINGSSQATGNPGSSALGCLEWNSTANNPMVSGWIQETVIYDSDQTSNRSVIESNIADYYGITI